MYGKCKNCAKQLSCHKPMGYRFGFCETDFEPKTKPEPERTLGMSWKQITSSLWEAKGRYGIFRIEHSGGRFWPRYASEDTSFKMPPKTKLSEAKMMCEDNENWEATV